MVRKFHLPVHKTLVLRSFAILPADVKRSLMTDIFPPIQIDEAFLKERLVRCAPKQMKWTSNEIKLVRDWYLIPFLLDTKAVVLTLNDLLNAERRYFHEWSDCLGLQHKSFDSDAPRSVHYPDDEAIRVLLISKPVNWSLCDILPPKQKSPEERQYSIDSRGKRVSN